MLKALAHSVYVISEEQKGTALKFVMYEKAKVQTERIVPLIDKYKGDLKFTVDANPYFTYQKQLRRKGDKEEDVLEIVKNILNEIKTLID